ncbi:hypothetical protein LTR28_013706, partial [Elasticomyces elasticus]
IDLLIGFEVEVVFLKRTSSASEPYEPWTKMNAWGTFTPEQYTVALPVLAEIVEALQEIGIPVQQFHSESGAGQYEFILPPLPPVQAIDTLVQARQVVQQIAATHQLRATLHPMPFDGVVTAAHAHISLNSASLASAGTEKMSMPFFASVLDHLPALCAFTLPETVSYKRIIADSWTSGLWVAWGTENREVPLRKISDGHWEFRCLDGMANMYLAIAAILAAGLLGVSEGLEMKMQDCEPNPNKLDEASRILLGITNRMPTDLETALKALEADEALRNELGSGLVNDYIVMKRAEQKMLEDMPEDRRRVWLIERY